MESTLIYGFGTKANFDKSEKEIQKNDHVETKELRKSPRIIVSKTIYFAIQYEFHKGVIKNLSRGGAFIKTKTKFSKGTNIKLVALTANKYILIKCKIIHFNQAGFGAKFRRILKIKKSPGTKKFGSQPTAQQKL